MRFKNRFKRFATKNYKFFNLLKRSFDYNFDDNDNFLNIVIINVVVFYRLNFFKYFKKKYQNFFMLIKQLIKMNSIFQNFINYSNDFETIFVMKVTLKKFKKKDFSQFKKLS